MRNTKFTISSCLVILFLSWFSSAIYAQEFHYVPDDFSTINAAITAASDGDFVVVRDGVYSGENNTNLNPSGKEIVIQSENGPASCIIECEGTARGFIVNSAETGTTVIRGFKIQHGYSEDVGGAIAIFNSDPLIDQCLFENNDADYGAAISVINSHASITNCHFFSNSSVIAGGCVFLANSTSVISNCYMAWNFSDSGAGVYSCWFSQPVLMNNLIVWNSAARGGGVASEFMGFTKMSNCTLSDNSGSGIYTYWGNCTVENSIIYGNNPQEFDYGETEPVVTYSCIKDGLPGMGNIDDNPEFRNGPQGEYYLFVPELPETNPCIDTGYGLAEEACWNVGSDMFCLDEYTTQVDMTADSDTVDMGYHYVSNDSCNRFSTRFLGPETEPELNEEVGLEVEVCNPGTMIYEDLNLFVIMEEGGEFWFWPSWTEIDWLEIDLDPGKTTWTIYDSEPWSVTPPAWYGNMFYGALTDPDVTEIIGEIGVYPYRFDL